MRHPIRTTALATAAAAAVAVGTTACVNDTYELIFDRLSCRTADKSLHTVQLVVTRGNTASTYATVTITGVRGDASVKKTSTWALVGGKWRGPSVTARNGNVNIKAVGGIPVNTWVETTRGSCLATGTVYWEGQYPG